MPSPSPIAATALVFAGGGTGAVLRYQLGRAMTRALGPATITAFPWATLAANVLGSLAMGVLAGWLARHGGGGLGARQAQLALGVGLLGGFTTFSSFSLEMMLLVERGQAGTALAYAAISLAAGLAGLYLGLVAMRVTA